jgi:pimeloyl-ACP methyl ester carboxylesterase
MHPNESFSCSKCSRRPSKAIAAKSLTPPELDFFVDTYTRTGFTGGINWYRNIDRNWELTKDLEYKVNAPSLYVGASNDVVLPPSSANGMEQMIGDLEKHTIADCGHWTQQEKPEEFNRIVIDWLDRKFGNAANPAK